MKLQYEIANSIWRYPHLYFHLDPRIARLRVLNSIFLVIGNGYEWVKDITNADYLVYDRIIRKRLPRDFFNKKLKAIYFEPSNKQKVEKIVKGYFHYFRRFSDRYELIIECSKEEATTFCGEFGTPPFRGMQMTAHYTDLVYPPEGLRYTVIYYPICKYSALSEIYEGVTTEGVPLNNIREDWMAGAIEIATEAHNFYSGKEGAIGESSYKGNQQFEREQLEFLTRFLEKFS